MNKCLSYLIFTFIQKLNIFFFLCIAVGDEPPCHVILGLILTGYILSLLSSIINAEPFVFGRFAYSKSRPFRMKLCISIPSASVSNFAVIKWLITMSLC